MTDVLERLRAADPVPTPVGYGESVARRNVDAIVRPDLTVRPAAAGVRRRRPWSVVAAEVLVLAVGGTLLGFVIHRAARPPAAAPLGSWTTFSATGVSFEHPAAWVSYRLDDPPGTVEAALTYLSTTPVVSSCTTTATGSSCARPSPSLVDGGVFVAWTFVTLPGQTPLPSDGVDATYGGHAAKVLRGVAAGCPDGTVDGVSATIADVHGARLRVDACLGAGEDVAAGLGAVDRMLASVRISG